jgi:hypothetical protein
MSYRVYLVSGIPYKFALLPCCYYRLQEIKMHGEGVASIMIMSTFREVRKLVRKLIGGSAAWCSGLEVERESHRP